MSDKEQKELRKKELAKERSDKADKERDVYAVANAEGIPRTMFHITKTRTVKNIVEAGRKKHEAATKKAARNAAIKAKGTPPAKMIKEELVKLGYTEKEIGRPTKNSTLSAVIRKAEERRKKELDKTAKEAGELALKEKLKMQLGNKYSNQEYKKPRKGQSENNVLRAFEKRLSAKKKKQLRETQEKAMKSLVKLQGFNSTNFKYRKNNTLNQHIVAAKKRAAAKDAKKKKEEFIERLKKTAIAEGLPTSLLKIRGKITNSAEGRLLAAAKKRLSAKKVKNSRQERIAALQDELAFIHQLDSKYLKFVGTKSDEVLIQEAIKRAKANKGKQNHGTRKQQILDILAPLQLTKEQIKKVVCVQSF